MGRARSKRTIETDIFGYKVAENPINSKRKGDTNERVAAKWLTEWTGVPFTRVPSSGGLRWKNSANVCGDLVCEDDNFEFPFAVETKHLKSIPMPETLRSNSIIFTILEQAKRDADRAGKKPMMILRQNGMPAGKFMIFFLENLCRLGLGYSCAGTSPEGERVYGYHSDAVAKLEFAELKNYF